MRILMRNMSVMRGGIMSSSMGMGIVEIGITMGVGIGIIVIEINKINKIKEIGKIVIIKETSPTGAITKTTNYGIKTFQMISKSDQSQDLFYSIDSFTFF